MVFIGFDLLVSSFSSMLEFTRSKYHNKYNNDATRESLKIFDF